MPGLSRGSLQTIQGDEMAMSQKTSHEITKQGTKKTMKEARQSPENGHFLAPLPLQWPSCIGISPCVSQAPGKPLEGKSLSFLFAK